MPFIDPDDAVAAPAATNNTSAPASKGGFIDPDEVGSSSREPAAAKSPADASGGGSDLHAFGRQTAESVAPGLTGLAGAAYGASTMAPYAVAAASAIPAPPLVKALVGGSLELLGAGVGAFAGGEGVGWVQDKLHQLIAPEDYAARKAEREQHPLSTMAGGVVGGALGLSPKVAIDPAAKFINTAMKARGASAVSMGAMTAGTQLATEGKIDPTQVTLSAATGAVLPGANRLGRPFSTVGHYLGSKKEPTLDTSKPPPDTATPEEKATWKKAKVEELKQRLEERSKKAPLVETAVRNKKTGEVIKMGPKHDQAELDRIEKEQPGEFDQGFVDESGNFHDRIAAVDQAKRAGQIKDDHVLENPTGTRAGLHSGDLRTVGDERFKLNETQKEGVPKEPPKQEEAPKGPTSREDYKKAIDDAEHRAYVAIEMEQEAAARDGNEPLLEQLKAEQQALIDHSQKLRGEMPTVKFENPVKPTWEELHDHLWGAKTVGEALDRVLSNKDLGGKGQRLLLQSLSKSNFIRSASLHFSDKPLKYFDKTGAEQSDAAGLYTGGTAHKVELGQGGNLRVLAHEAVHAGTQRLLAEGNSAAAIKLTELFNKYKASHSGGEYGFNDVHEFVSEAFTRNSFQELLSKIDAGTQPKTGTGSLWSQFKEAIREGLNLPPGTRTALDEVLDQGTNLIIKSKDFHSNDGIPGGVSLPSKVIEAVDKVDPRSLPDREAMMEHATNLYTKYGEDVALKFIEDFETNLKERYIPTPTDEKSLDDALHMVATFETADKSEHVIGYKETAEKGLGERPSMLHPIKRKAWDKKAEAQLKAMNVFREAAFLIREKGGKVPGELGKVLDAIDAENLALVRKIKAMGGEVGDEFTTGQSRIRLFEPGVTSNFKAMVAEFFANRMPFSEKIAEKANAAHERKVFQLDDERVVELHRIQEDAKVPIKGPDGKTTFRNVRKGTEIWQWKDGNKKMIGRTDNLEFKVGDKVKLIGPDGKGFDERTLTTGKVPAIEEHSPYRYLHDAEASARLANMGLRKMARDLELVESLKKSELFKRVGHSPDEPLKTLPKGWKIPESIDKIPQLRGWHFDPKTAAIIEDFAKVWDNTLVMKLTNQLVKNMMLNPLPHMLNEVMHLFNARGFTGWVPLTGGWSRLATTGRRAWNDVANQTQFYRDVMREGGSILGADPRNHFFDELILNNSRVLLDDAAVNRGVTLLAKKLGTSVGGLYNGISRKSQQAMWFTRDVMYVQYIRETMQRHEKATGNKMDLKDAIAKVEKHMPNYRMPPEVLGSRFLSKTLKNPNVSLFSRYHYGMVKSLVNTVKDIDPRNLKTPEGRKEFREGVDSLLAIGVAMTVLYPLMDEVMQSIFGEGAEQRRAGPYHLIDAAVKVAEGEKDSSALIYPIFTFNPILLSLGQLAFNRNLFTGKNIYHPDDPAEDIVGDVAAYGVKQIPQAPGVRAAATEDGGGEQFLAKQIDVKVKTDAQRKAERTARKHEAAAAKGRIKKRKEGIYRQ